MKNKTSTYTQTIGGKSTYTFKLGRRTTTPNHSVQHTVEIEQIIDLAGHLSEYERCMLTQWFSEIYG